MAFSQWTFSGDGSGSLSTSTKYAGASSYNSYIFWSIASADKTNYLSRNSFTCQQLQVILWAKLDFSGTTNSTADMNIYHPSYGTLNLTDAGATWTKYRISFWYDSGANTKFGRIEKWVTDTWVQQGSDTNFGTGSPSTDTIELKTHLHVGLGGANTLNAYYDELEVYTAAL